jgi:anti-sigma regulatory factor (Ser/Thr protein kinase)
VETILSAGCPQAVFHIGEPSEIAAARRAGSELARRLGFNEIKAGELALVITEAATNIVKHAVRGEILLRQVISNGGSGIEVLAVDVGPGMSNLAHSMQDGVSTAGSYGVGFGAMHRLANEFDVYTAPGKGTVICMTLWADNKAVHPSQWEIGVVCLPMPGEDVCGDSWAANIDHSGITLLVADGLGHGPEAAEASRAAAAILAGHADLLPVAAIQLAHRALQGTRGAAAAIARIDRASEEMRFAGVGNIAVCVVQAESRQHMVSHNGIVGSNLRKAQEFLAPCGAGAIVIMHSDGIGTRWDLKQYPGLETRHPALIAAVLYRDFARKRDDVTVLVLRANSRKQA